MCRGHTICGLCTSSRGPCGSHIFSTGVLMTKPEKITSHNQANLPCFTFLVVDKLFPQEINKKSVVTFFGKYSSIEQPEQPVGL